MRALLLLRRGLHERGDDLAGLCLVLVVVGYDTLSYPFYQTEVVACLYSVFSAAAAA